MPKQVYFPPIDPTWDPDRGVVRFYAVVEDRTVVCKVTIEALNQYFGVHGRFAGNEAIQAFMRYRPEIEDAARTKIEQEMTTGQQDVLLGTDDFRMTTTTIPAPVPFERLETVISEAIRSNPEIMEVVRQANRILAQEFVRGSDHVTAEWNLVPGSPSLLLKLTLTDRETTARTERPFTREDLRTAYDTRYALFPVWDDLLQNKMAKRLENVSEGA